MKKTAIRIISVLLCLSVLLPLHLTAFAANKTKYIIGNPYEEVDWSSWQGYKTQLHCHTNLSDGALPLAEVVEEHYRLNYDILAITDHMIIGREWNAVPQTVPLARLIKYERTKMLPAEVLTNERREEILSGADRGGRGMLEITQGVELNGGVPSNSHINGFFSEYGQGKLGVDGDYETPASEVEKQGGVTFLDHLGNYTKAHSKNDPDISRNPFYVNKFSRIFLDNKTCLGTDINSGNDTHTQHDRILYDEILQKTIPNGRNVWAFTFSDAHSPGEFDRAFTLHMMPELTAGALRKSMESGAFFSVSRRARFEEGDNYEGKGAMPEIKEITVDSAKGTISIEAENYYKIVWVSNGNEIAENTSNFNPAKYDGVGCYVRAYLVGEGGILYVQPFTLEIEGKPFEPVHVPKTVDYSLAIRTVLNLVDYFLSPSSHLRMLWMLITGFDPAVNNLDLSPWFPNLSKK